MGSPQIALDRKPLSKAATPKLSAVVLPSEIAKRRKAFLKQNSVPQSTLTAKGQMTLPKEVRDFLGIKPGDKVKFFMGLDGRVAILPIGSITALRGIFKGRVAKPLTIEEMEEGIAEGAVERYRRFLNQ